MADTTHAAQPYSVAVQAEDFQLESELLAMRAGSSAIGAICSFVGLVRDYNAQSRVATLELEHYPGMTERSIHALISEARERFDIQAARVVHRIGPLPPGDNIVLVAVASAHRAASFQACEFLMDRLKTEVPFWKREDTSQGPRWVDPRVSDEAAADRWHHT